MRIKVTQDHIARGARNIGTRCPIAIAVREQTLLKDAFVNSRGVFTNQDVAQSMIVSPLDLYTIPIGAREFIVNYDTGRPVYPFEFDLI